MGLVVSSVGPGGKLVMSNGQTYQAGPGAIPSTPNGPDPMNPYAPYPTQLAPTQAMGLGLNAAQNPYSGPKGVLAGPDTPTGGGTAGGPTVDWSKVPQSNGPRGTYSGTTPPVPNAPVPPPIDYYKQYDDALSASRANLENQYVQAQHSIDQQQNDANATLMGVPGTFASIAKQQEAANTRETGTLIAADNKAGMGASSEGGALKTSQAEMASAGTQNDAGNKALVPGLALGVKTQMDAERASLADAHSTASGALDAAAMNVQASRANAEQQNANATTAEKTAHDQAVTDATTAYKRQLTLAALTSGAKLDDLSTKVPGMTAGDEKALATSGYFTLATNEMNTGKMADGSKFTPAALVKQISGLNENAKIPGYSGAASTGLLSVLKAYFPSTLG